MLSEKNGEYLNGFHKEGVSEQNISSNCIVSPFRPPVTPTSATRKDTHTHTEQPWSYMVEDASVKTLCHGNQKGGPYPVRTSSSAHYKVGCCAF